MTTPDDDFDGADEFESAAENPELAAAAAALAVDSDEPELPDPLDGPVTLPAGYRRIAIRDGQSFTEEVTKAWVKELNGEDEERIAKAKLRDEPGAFLEAVLECGVERLGGERPTRDDLRRLVIGDRDFLLFEIARATYGNDLDYEDFVCYHCNEPLSFTVHLDTDVPVKRLSSLKDAEFEVRLKGDRVATLTLPTVEDSVAGAAAKTDAEFNTVLIAASVVEIRGPKGVTRINGDVEAARRLGLVDRQTLVNEMSKRMPGPQYNEVKFVHPDCGKEIRLTITLADLFRGM